MAKQHDYIIVGAGSAGCVLAARLSEDPGVRVLLLEAGGRDGHPYIHIPAGFAKMTTGPLTWGLKTAPQRHAHNREIPYAQARVLGGGSSINAQVFTRGTPEDYDRWAGPEGCPGWSFKDVLPYFIRSEGNETLAEPWHGSDGPLGVCDLQSPQPVTRAFVRSCQQLGMRHNFDFNGAAQTGAGFYQATVRDARRCSAAAAYLKPALGRPNLTVETGCVTTRIMIAGGRARGVEFRQAGETKAALADMEVLVAAGAIGSPKLLMLSGVGPTDHLKAVGVEPVHDLPGVGQNLQDHFGVDVIYELSGAYSLDKYNQPHWMAWAGLQYALFKSGPVASNVVEAGAFWRADRSEAAPDLQFHFLPGSGMEAGVPPVPTGAGCTLNSYTLRPKSRGSVTLRSANPQDAAIVDPNFIAEPDDLRLSVEGVAICRDIMGQKALSKFIRRAHFPSADLRGKAELETYVRANGRTSYHPVGACRMGGDAMAVVDPQLRVRGIDRLRVCDSSIMPSLIGSNTNAAAIMIGEKASDLVRGNR